MVNEAISVRLGTMHPEDNPALAGCCPPPPGRVFPLADEAGQPLLPRIVKMLRSGVALPAPEQVVRTRGTTVAGVSAPVLPAAELAAIQARARHLQAVAAGELLGRSVLGLGRMLRDAVVLPSPVATLAGRMRSVLDAGAAYPGVDGERMAYYQALGRKLQAEAAGEWIARGAGALAHALRSGAAALGRALWRLLEPSQSSLRVRMTALYGKRGPLDVPPDYEQRRANYYGRGL